MVGKATKWGIFPNQGTRLRYGYGPLILGYAFTIGLYPTISRRKESKKTKKIKIENNVYLINFENGKKRNNYFVQSLFPILSLIANFRNMIKKFDGFFLYASFAKSPMVKKHA
jgi:hypothetical protein